MSDLLRLRDMEAGDSRREQRLDEIRREAERRGKLQVVSPRPAGNRAGGISRPGPRSELPDCDRPGRMPGPPCSLRWTNWA